jgi:Tol biopolymer transport system component
VHSTSNWPRFSVSPNGRLVAYTRATSDNELTDILVSRIGSGDSVEQNARPYWDSDVLYPSWSPDGGRIVFAAREWSGGDPFWEEEYELWLLDSIALP